MRQKINNHQLKFMNLACHLAEQAFGKTGKNPAVGCVITYHDNAIIATATAKNGRPHAEYIALKEFQQHHVDAAHCHLYVTLEPCLHDENTPSCAQLIIDSGIKYVTIATYDSDIRTAKKSANFLKQHHIMVDFCHDETIIKRLNNIYAGFHMRMRYQRPLIALKIATSLDGKIALSNNQSQWITDEKSRYYGQILRCYYDAILVGGNTFFHDHPRLNQRISNDYPQPLRIILLGKHIDENMILRDYDAALKREQKTIYVTQHPIKNLPKNVILSYGYDGLDKLVKYLGDIGINNLLIEGGSKIAAAFMQANLIDHIYHFQAPKYIGGDGIDSIGDLLLQHINMITENTIIDKRQLDNDYLTIYDIKNLANQ